LTEILIGAGGWAYFHVPREDPLKAYARAFNFVEVNSTFYEYPDMRTVRSWRRKAPKDFEFAVRCHRDVTHGNRLKPSSANVASLERVLDICEALMAPVLHVLTPRDMKFSKQVAENLQHLVASVNLGQVRIALEILRADVESLDQSAIRVMQDLNIAHCVDLSQREPAYTSDLLYTRLFGPREDNIYQFTDEELESIDAKASRPEFEKSVLAFHGVKMYKDAARLKVFRSTGSFPSVTSSVGLESLREVLSEDQSFPTSKATLIWSQGWKIIDLTSDRRVPAATVLAELPDRQYLSLDDVLVALRNQGLGPDRRAFSTPL